MHFDTIANTLPYELIQDRETYDLALAMVEKLGPSALYEALNKVEYHENQNNQVGAYLWRRVETAVNLLLSQEPRGAIH
ncbi:MAG: hypothetical protein ACFBZ9_05430 [Sphingomonadales bacterium]